MSNSRYLLTGCSDSTVVLWDIKNRSISKTLEVEEESEQLCMLMERPVVLYCHMIS